MYCEKCGNKLPDNAKFCSSCGNEIFGGTIKAKVPDTEILINIKPTFKLLYLYLPVIIIYLPIALILAVMLLFVSPIASLIIIMLFIGIFSIIIFINKKQYDSYTYDFYRTKVIYKDSFLNLSEKEVKYKYIREVTMRQTFIQRYFNIGNIILFTNAETGYGNGIFIRNVENVSDVYKKIKTIIDV